MFDEHGGRAGSLVAQALGDALGFLVEGCSPDLCRDYIDEAFSKNGPPPYRRARFYFGQYSDDTQLARELALSLGVAPVGVLASAPYFVEEFARRVARQFKENLIVGRGSATEAAAHKLIAGIPWNESGTPSPSAGNGAAMRAAPVGFLNVSDADLVRIADDSAIVTHADVRSRAAAILVALVVNDAIRHGPAKPYDIWFDRLAQYVQPYDPLLASGVRQMPVWLADDVESSVEGGYFIPPADFVAEEITAWSEPPEGATHDFKKWQGISPFATPSVLYALYSYCRHPDQPEKVLHTAISGGGDVDTVAAMAGAMVGAAVGLNGLTPRLLHWASYLNDQGLYGVDELVKIAESVW